MAVIFPTSAMLPSSVPASSRTSFSPVIATASCVRRLRAKMSSSVTVAQLESPIVLGFGGVGVDLLATVATFPNPDDKIRSTSLKVQGGGNAGNALTCAARLGLNARLISKVANDAQGRGILEEFEADGLDVSFFVVSEEGNSPFTYVIVDNQTKTRTCIHTPGAPPMIPDDISNSTLLAALTGVKLVYFDVRLPETAVIVAHEANRRKIPILIDAERPREGLDDLLHLSDYVVCSAKLPQTWTGAPSIPSALVSMLLRLPKVKFVIVTLGADGCIMLERSTAENVQAEEMDVDDLVELLKSKVDSSTASPTCISSGVTRLQAKGVGTICGKLFLGTAEKVPQSELVDTTGAGDAFIGAVLYEFWYKTTYHATTGKSPFEVVYGRKPPDVVQFIPGEVRVEAVGLELRDRDEALRQLKQHLQQAQDYMKQQADQCRRKVEFEIGDRVYVRLRPYRQFSVAHRINQKLSARYFGPFPVLEKVGAVAYKLQLPPSSRVHPIFHVSLLKKDGMEGSNQQEIPPSLEWSGEDLWRPESVLSVRTVKQGGR